VLVYTVRKLVELAAQDGRDRRKQPTFILLDIMSGSSWGYNASPTPLPVPAMRITSAPPARKIKFISGGKALVPEGLQSSVQNRTEQQRRKSSAMQPPPTLRYYWHRLRGS